MPWRRLAVGLAVCLTLNAAQAADTAQLPAPLRTPKPGAGQICPWLLACDGGAAAGRHTRRVPAQLVP